jgi:hypothetical protein
VADSEWLLFALVAAGAAATAIIVLYVTRMRKPRTKEAPEQHAVSPSEAWTKRFSATSQKTVTTDEAKEAKEKLKTLDLEREILSFAIRRLYEAQAEGKINEEEREQISQHYKDRMLTIRDSITKNESVVALHELESMQDDLVKLFSERFDELGQKVEELRTRLEIKAAEEEETRTPTIDVSMPELEEAEEPGTDKDKEKKKPRKKPAPAPAPKTDAEKRIEEIRTEVEKVLERLGQMEVEGES